jgi:hypothetical protein
MIRGLHGLFYSSEPEALRAFLRDTLRLPFTDVGRGWLIFDLPEGDVGVHPVDSDGPPRGTHDVSFYCDDIRATVAELRGRGVAFKQEPADHGYGYVTYFEMPGGVEVQLYEPKYVKRRGRPASKPRRKPARKPAARKKAARSPKPRARARKRKR